MKQASKRVLGVVAISALLIGAGSSGVFARGGFGPGWGGHQGMMGGPGFGGPGMFQTRNLGQLKTTLGITPEQESAWGAYAAAVEAKTDLMTTHRQAMFNGAVTPEDRIAFHQQGLAQMQQVVQARQALYAVLTPEQQAKAGNMVGNRCRRW
jgi:Spy/CpxP family protein refolding chaperone